MAAIDFDGDGSLDVAINNNAYTTGHDGVDEQVTVYYSPLSLDGSTPTATFTPEGGHSVFGLTLSRLPDVSGDGIDELLVSDSSNDLGHLYFGQGD